MMFNKHWLTDVYLPSELEEKGKEGYSYMMGAVTLNKDSLVHLLVAIRTDNHWVLHRFIEGVSSIEFHINNMGWTGLIDAYDPVYGVVFGGETGWEWDVVRAILEDEDTSDLRYESLDKTTGEIQEILHSWGKEMLES